ncbi:MAG: hypothetical protein HC871_11750, partial [Rhizobiales bacterium]|nr:hypothetical protein [Hyphomicrobiales bacterium]
MTDRITFTLDGREVESDDRDPLRAAYATLVSELHDEELDEALAEVATRARALHDEQLAEGVAREDADQVVR